MEIQLQVQLTLYTAAELSAFHGKIENQLILGNTRLYFNPCDMVVIARFSKLFLKHSFSSFSYVVIAAKFVVTIISCF